MLRSKIAYAIYPGKHVLRIGNSFTDSSNVGHRVPEHPRIIGMAGSLHVLFLEYHFGCTIQPLGR